MGTGTGRRGVTPRLSFRLIRPRPQPFTGVRGRLPGLVTNAGGRW